MLLRDKFANCKGDWNFRTRSLVLLAALDSVDGRVSNPDDLAQDLKQKADRARAAGPIQTFFSNDAGNNYCDFIYFILVDR